MLSACCELAAALHTVCSSSLSAEAATVRDTGNLVYLSQQKWGDGPWHEAPSKLFEVARRFYKLCLLAFISSACRSWHMSGLPMQDNCKMPAQPIGSQ